MEVEERPHRANWNCSRSRPVAASCHCAAIACCAGNVYYVASGKSKFCRYLSIEQGSALGFHCNPLTEPLPRNTSVAKVQILRQS